VTILQEWHKTHENIFKPSSIKLQALKVEESFTFRYFVLSFVAGCCSSSWQLEQEHSYLAQIIQRNTNELKVKVRCQDSVMKQTSELSPLRHRFSSHISVRPPLRGVTCSNFKSNTDSFTQPS